MATKKKTEKLEVNASNINIKVGDVDHPLEKFSDSIKQAVAIYNQVNEDLKKHQIEVIKCQAALVNLGKQITDAAADELNKEVPKE